MTANLLGLIFSDRGQAVCLVTVEGDKYLIRQYRQSSIHSIDQWRSWIKEGLDLCDKPPIIYTDSTQFVNSQMRRVKPGVRLSIKPLLIDACGADGVAVALLSSAINVGRVETVDGAILERLRKDLESLSRNSEGRLIMTAGLEAIALSLCQEEYRLQTQGRSVSIPVGGEMGKLSNVFSQ